MTTSVRRTTLAILGAFLVLTALMEYRARTELSAARAARDRTEAAAAITHYGRALNWYVPWGAAETAADELYDLGMDLEAKGRPDLANLAWVRLRSTLYGNRSLFTPRTDLIAKVEPFLARHLARTALGSGAASAELEKKTREYLDIMRQPARPATGPGLAATGGFLAWVLAVFMVIFKGRNPEGRIDPRRSWPWVPLWAIGFALWLWGLQCS